MTKKTTVRVRRLLVAVIVGTVTLMPSVASADELTGVAGPIIAFGRSWT